MRDNYVVMSRRRCTTAKMFSGSRQGGPKRPSQSRPSMPETTRGQDDGGEPSGKGEALTTDTLSRHLAAEALLRESSERRTATVIKRYFRLTIALAGINALVAGTTMIALWARSSRGPEIVEAPSTPAPQPKLNIVPSPPAPTTPAATPTRPAPVPAAAPLPTPSTKPEALAPIPRSRRPAAKIQIAHRPADDTKTVALDSVVERW
jgi:hypothetical protein